MTVLNKIRLVQTQVCPLFRYFEITAPLNRCVDIRILKHDKRRVAAQLHGGSLERRRTGLLQTPPHFGRARKGQVSDQRTVGQCGPISEERPTTTLRTPAAPRLAPPSSAIASADKGVSEAGLITMLQPAAKAGAAFARNHGVGEVPGRNRRHDADRLLDTDHSLVS